MPAAFPTFEHVKSDAHYQLTDPGMDLRDYFAAKAMQAMLSNTDTLRNFDRCAKENLLDPECALADAAYCIADAMLDARKRGKTKKEMTK